MMSVEADARAVKQGKDNILCYPPSLLTSCFKSPWRVGQFHGVEGLTCLILSKLLFLSKAKIGEG